MEFKGDMFTQSNQVLVTFKRLSKIKQIWYLDDQDSLMSSEIRARELRVNVEGAADNVVHFSSDVEI